jgi:hypothetical protein
LFLFQSRHQAARETPDFNRGKRMRHLCWLLVPGAAFLAALPAQARPRDEALSGAFRCAAIADSRAWLDCYYGAAQPVRAALGMAPALAGQVKLAASPPAGGAPRDEAVRDDVMAGAAGCNRVSGDRPWLDCYYAAAVPMRAQLGLSVPAQTAAQPAPKPALPPAYVPPSAPAKLAGPPPMPRNTGLFNGMFNDIKPVVRDMPVASVVFDKNGAFTVTLSDGEIWAQAAEDEVYHPARWRDPGPNMLVTIAPDALHTFSMTVAGEDRFYKVKRIR